jgi:hypothetical protein
MHFLAKRCLTLLGIAALFVAAGLPARAQERQHVVSLSDLSKDAARPAQTRQANEEAVRTLLSSDQGQQALKSAGLNYQKVDKAVGQLSDEDLAKLARISPPDAFPTAICFGSSLSRSASSCWRLRFVS